MKSNVCNKAEPSHSQMYCKQCEMVRNSGLGDETAVCEKEMNSHLETAEGDMKIRR